MSYDGGKMKVAVVAANGRTGQSFVAAALAAGIGVRAGVYGQHNFPQHPNLEVVQCDGTLREQVDNLIDGVDAVVSVIGHGPHTPANVQTDTIRNVLSSMQQKNVSRIISLTGTGVRMPGDKPNILDRLATVGIRIIDPARVHDGIEHAKLLQSSASEWTLLRVLKLSNQSYKGAVPKMNLTGPAERLTPRDKVAAAMIEILQSGIYKKQSPIIVKG